MNTLDTPTILPVLSDAQLARLIPFDRPLHVCRECGRPFDRPADAYAAIMMDDYCSLCCVLGSTPALTDEDVWPVARG